MIQLLSFLTEMLQQWRSCSLKWNQHMLSTWLLW